MAIKSGYTAKSSWGKINETERWTSSVLPQPQIMSILIMKSTLRDQHYQTITDAEKAVRLISEP